MIVNYKITKYSTHLSRKLLEEYVRLGFEMWENHTEYKFIQVEDHQNLSIEFLKDHPIFDDMKTQGFLDSETLMIFNDKLYWSRDGAPIQMSNDFGKTISIQTGKLPIAVAHEFGHVLDLNHSIECDDLMSCPLDIEVTTFSENDLKRIRRKIKCRKIL